MNRELETRYKQMKLTWKNLVNANIDLVDENKLLKEEIEILNNIINEFDKWLDEESEKTILSTGHLTCLMMCKNKLQELKGNGSNG